MKGFRVKADDPNTPQQVYNHKVYICSIIAACGALLFGYDSAFIGSLLSLPSFKSDFGLDKLSTGAKAYTSANITSTFQAGCFWGVIFAYPFAERFGRRIVIGAATVVFNVGVILQMVSQHSLNPFYAGRALCGLGVGAITLACPVYISEISPPAIRGQLIGYYEMAYQLAALVGFWINYGVNKNISGESSEQWHIPVAVQFIPASLLCLGTLYLPETPRFLLKRGEDSKALATLSWIRNLPEDDSYISQEIYAIKDQLDNEVVASGAGRKNHAVAIIKELCTKGIRNRLIIGCCLMLAQNATGINAINYYSTTIFESIGVTGTNAGLFATGIYGVVKLITSSIFLLFLVDRIGRRLPLIIGGVACVFAMFYIGTYIKLAHPKATSGATPDGAGISAVAFIYIYVSFYCMSWNGIAWIYNAEIFPNRIRGICAVFTTCFQWLGQFAITRATPYMFDSMGYGVYYFFGAMGVVITLFAYFFIKETKGIPLEQMDELWGYKHVLVENRGQDIESKAPDAASMSMSSDGDKVEIQMNETI